MTTPAGWYPDPSGAGGRRYFDGMQWTEQHTPPSVPTYRAWPWLVAAAFFLVLGGGAALFMTVGTRD